MPGPRAVLRGAAAPAPPLHPPSLARTGPLCGRCVTGGHLVLHVDLLPPGGKGEGRPALGPQGPPKPEARDINSMLKEFGYDGAKGQA